MMYYVKIHTINGKNNLQKAIVAEYERWNGTLITDTNARETFIKRMKDTVSAANAIHPKCLPCIASTYQESLVVSVEGSEGSFVQINLNKVNLVYDGKTANYEMKGGEQ